jgi:hypothetical protein
MTILSLIIVVAVALGPETYHREMKREEVEEEKVGPQSATLA